MRARESKGSVVYNKTRATWNLLWVENRRRRSIKLGTFEELPTRAEAMKRADAVRRHRRVAVENRVPSVSRVIDLYRAKKMPQRYSTSQGYESWFRNHIAPRWGENPITDLRPCPVEEWLDSLDLSPKSRAHIRGLLHRLFDFAMWSDLIPVQTNPISLVEVPGSSKRLHQPRSLKLAEFQRFVLHLEEPFRTMALICVCFGLRISECLALKWSDVDWLDSKLSINRGIVRQRVDEVKTIYSGRPMSIDGEMLGILRVWKQATEFSSESDWMFASPIQLGRQPWCYDQVLRNYLRAAELAGIGRIGTHTMRHTYRSWLDAAGTPVAVQQKLMRHGDIRTTMNIYGDVVTDEMQQAHSKVVRMAMSRPI